MPTSPYTVATLPWEIQVIFQQYYTYILQIITCKMHNIFIWLQVCCIPPNVGGSKLVVGWHWWLWKEPVVMCGKWNAGQATLQQMFIVQSDHFLHGYRFPVFFATDQLYSRLVLNTCEKMKDLCILQCSAVTFAKDI